MVIISTVCWSMTNSLAAGLPRLNEGYAKVARAATEISRDGLEDMREHLSRLEHTLGEVSEAVAEAVGVSADVLRAGRLEHQEAPPPAAE